MSAFATWLVSTFLLVGAAELVVRLIPESAASKRYVFWWGVLAAVILWPWTPTLAGVLLPGIVGDSSGQVSGAADTGWLRPALSAEWLRALAAIWVVAAALRALELVHGVIGVARLAEDSRPIPESELERHAGLAAARLVSRAVTVCESDHVRGACAVGYRRPRILLSPALRRGLDADAVEAVLLHEYAHLQRYDDWTCLLQGAVRALGVLHPAVWWICRQLDTEREAACDGAVVARTKAPVAYARALGVAAEIVATTRGLIPHAVPGASMLGSGFHSRVARVLRTTPASPSQVWSAVVVAATTLAVAAGAVQHLPPFVRIVDGDDPVRRARAESSAAPALLGEPRAAPPAALSSRDAATVTVSAAVPRANQARVRGPSRPTETRVGEAERAVVASSAAPTSDDAQPQPLPGDGWTVIEGATVAPPLAPLVPSTVPLEVLFQGPGARAARVGSVTGHVASQAGLAIGTFFRTGGRAVATRF